MVGWRISCVCRMGIAKEKNLWNQDLRIHWCWNYYNMLEFEIVPALLFMFKWTGYIFWMDKAYKKYNGKNSPRIYHERMIDDYYEKYYNKLFKRNKYLTSNNFEKAKPLNAWKKAIKDEWIILRSWITVLRRQEIMSIVQVMITGRKLRLIWRKIPKDNVGVEFI